jgi:hypothetical protein
MNVASAIKINSNALLLLGHSPISSFSDPGSGAQVASNLYESTLTAMLEDHRWRFATKKVQLAQLAQAPDNEFTYQYQLPTDLIKFIKIYEGGDYEIYGDKVYTNRNTCNIDYVFRIDETFFRPSFTKALEYHLAAQYAVPVTGNASRGGHYNDMYEKQLRRAKHTDSSERPNTGIIDSPFTDVR